MGFKDFISSVATSMGGPVGNRLGKFISGVGELNYDELLPQMEAGVNISVLAAKAFSATRDIREMLKDAIIGGSVKIILETAFQPSMTSLFLMFNLLILLLKMS